ncbi:MAG: hypothetical protein Q9222_006037 [Ikaeria aurantiellina]
MKREAEKTFGPSPESRKRTRVQRAKRTKPKPQQPKTTDLPGKSESLCIPPNNEQLDSNQVDDGADITTMGAHAGDDHFENPNTVSTLPGSTSEQNIVRSDLANHNETSPSSRSLKSNSSAQAHPQDFAAKHCAKPANSIIEDDEEGVSISAKEKETRAAPQNRRQTLETDSSLPQTRNCRNRKAKSAKEIEGKIIVAVDL